MKKNLLTACFILILSVTSKAQLDTIPNAGFEIWHYTPNFSIEADFWQSNNSEVAAWNVIPDSFPHSGMLALRLIHYSYRGTIWSGFHLANHPLTLEGFAKNGLGIGDSAVIRIHIYSANVIVDSGYAAIYGGIGSNFLPFSVNISQNVSIADSCVITLEGGNYFGGAISFDDLSFSFLTSTGENNKKEGWNIFPNPCSNVLIVATAGTAETNCVLTLHDIAGKIIHEENLPVLQKSCALNMQPFDAGAYLLSVNTGEKRVWYIVVKN